MTGHEGTVFESVLSQCKSRAVHRFGDYSCTV